MANFISDFKKIFENRPSKFQLNEMLRSLRALLTVKSTRALLATNFRMKLPLLLERLISNKEPIMVEHLLASLAQIAFDEDQLIILRTNKSLLERLQKMKETHGSESSWVGALREAEGLVWTLNNKQNERIVVTTTTTTTSAEDESKKPKLMISYNWQHKQIALKMAEYLRNQNFIVWQDVSDMKGDIMTAMAKAVQESDIVLVLVSTGYFASSNCQRECTYAASLKKKIVPFFVEAGYFPSDWLGILISGLLYYEISEDRLDSVLSLAVRNELKGTKETNKEVIVTTTNSLENKIDALVKENEQLKIRLKSLEDRIMRLESSSS